MKKTIRTFIPKDGSIPRTFECYITDVMGGHSLIEVSIYEVQIKKKWWHSRTQYFGCKNFWIDDFASIVDGIDAVISNLLVEEQEYNMRKKKLEEYNNRN